MTLSAKKPNPLLEIAITILVPALVLMKLSGDTSLGPMRALLLALDARWLAVKEAAVPLVIGLVVLGSTWTKTPLIRALVFNASLFDVDRVQQALQAKHNMVPFELRLRQSTLLQIGRAHV